VGGRMMKTRRDFLRTTGAALGAAVLSNTVMSLPGNAADGALVAQVGAACMRLAPLGWRDMLLKVTGGQFDLTAANLGAELSKTLTAIDRSQPGFGDFNSAGTRGVSPGQPDLSLLYHAFAAPTVVTGADGKTPLGGFPTLAEIATLENYIYAAANADLAKIRTQARAVGGQDLAIVVYALEYRNVSQSVGGRAAQLCFSRTGISHLGTIEPFYDGARRSFATLDPARPFAFRSVPQRFAAFLATRVGGAATGFAPQDMQPGDDKRDFWVPLHKLFDGPECLAGTNLSVAFTSHLVNEKLRQFQRYMTLNGVPGARYTEDQLNQYPFVLRDAEIGALSNNPDFGPGVLVPRPRAKLAEVATLPGSSTPLTFEVPSEEDYPKPLTLYYSSLQILPVGADTEPAYMAGRAPEAQRPAPEYVNVRHRLQGDTIESLNRRPDMMRMIYDGKYPAVHYIDYAGNGWIEVRCPAIEAVVKSSKPAYVIVSPPDFFPSVSQRELTRWWLDEMPVALQKTLWALPPLPLSQQRMAADVTLAAGFSINDTTMTCLVAQPGGAAGPAQLANGPNADRSVGLPDAAAGIFDPGWETSQGYIYLDKGNDPSAGDPPAIQPYMQSIGLGTPFLEDVKLCATLGNYWPGVAPDNTRSFPPEKQASPTLGFSYSWPTSAPLTDIETGIDAFPGSQTFMPWDGVRGPRMDKEEVVYADIYDVDYIDLQGTMTAALTGKIDFKEYIARVVSMEAVYWALGIHPVDSTVDSEIRDILRQKARWALQSFRTVEPKDKTELAAAVAAVGADPQLTWEYRFFLFTANGQSQDKARNETRVLIKDRVVAYTARTDDPNKAMVLLQRNGGQWALDTTMPT